MSYTRYAIILKVFGKGFGEEPFLRKVCPDKEQKFYKSTAVTDLRFFVSAAIVVINYTGEVEIFQV